MQWTQVGTGREPKLAEGFILLAYVDPVIANWEPLYSRVVDLGVQLATRLRIEHCNGRQQAHISLIAGLADHAMALSCTGVPRADASRLPVTVSMSSDFIGSARVGQWLEVRPRVLRLTRTLGFVEALIAADDKIVARASATYRLG